MLARTLIALGMTFRSVLILAVFLTLFIFGSIVIPFVQNGNIGVTWVSCLIPLVIVCAILISALISSSTRSKLIAHSEKCSNSKRHKAPNKFFIAFACHGTYVAVGILLICFLLVLQFDKYLFEIFAIYVFGGWAIIYKIMWPFFIKKMK